MSIFILTVGIPASGKDTLYYDNYRDNFIMVSSDDIRQELYGDAGDQTHNTEVFNTMFNRSVKYLSEGKNVYYNATNLSQKRRINLLKELRNKVDNIHAICIIFPLPYKECLNRNTCRARVVPEYVMERMVKNFEVPDYCEGWDNILFHRDGGTTNIENIVAAARQIPHDNPHHTLTIGGHMDKAAYLYISDCLIEGLPTDNVMLTVLKYHDIGKPFCKVFTNHKGEPSEIAHYYNHEHVGAYIYLSSIPIDYLENNDEALLIANLISHHMDKFKDNYLPKIEKLYGSTFCKALATINEYDTAAH